MKVRSLKALVTGAFCCAVFAGCNEPTSLHNELADSAPHIDAVDIDLDGAGLLMLTAAASDPGGGAIAYAWGSRALTPPALGESQIVVAREALRGYSTVAHLVVQNPEGKVAGAEVRQAADGTFERSLVPVAVDEPCVVSYDRCTSRCAAPRSTDNTLDASCRSDCLVGLALCRADPS